MTRTPDFGGELSPCRGAPQPAWSSPAAVLLLPSRDGRDDRPIHEPGVLVVHPNELDRVVGFRFTDVDRLFTFHIAAVDDDRDSLRLIADGEAASVGFEHEHLVREGVLPESRAVRCPEEWAKIDKSWNRLPAQPQRREKGLYRGAALGMRRFRRRLVRSRGPSRAGALRDSEGGRYQCFEAFRGLIRHAFSRC